MQRWEHYAVTSGSAEEGVWKARVPEWKSGRGVGGCDPGHQKLEASKAQAPSAAAASEAAHVRCHQSDLQQRESKPPRQSM